MEKRNRRTRGNDQRKENFEGESEEVRPRVN
jgi:hypothetical protein